MVIKVALVEYASDPRFRQFSLEVTLQVLSNGMLRVTYELVGNIAQLLIPEVLPATECAGLWQHTCFELFAGAQGRTDYREFNFSPSTQWAAYAFSDYRLPEVWHLQQNPQIEVIRQANRLVVIARIAIHDLPVDIKALPWQIGLSAVLEMQNGHLSYWALRHPVAQADFHHRDGFTVLLPSDELS